MKIISNDMKQKYNKYSEWEDFKNGMYDISKREYENILICRGAILLSDPERFEKSARNVIENWPVTTENHLTNVSQNRRSWLGQAACNYAYKIPEILTRKSWSIMSPMAQDVANKVADKLIKEYEEQNSEIHKSLGRPLLF
jgi:hypothetical protein